MTTAVVFEMMLSRSSLEKGYYFQKGITPLLALLLPSSPATQLWSFESIISPLKAWLLFEKDDFIIKNLFFKMESCTRYASAIHLRLNKSGYK